jgi:hypothetical protein
MNKKSKKFLTRGEFAKAHGVTAKTIVVWARRGYVKFGRDGRMVDVKASEKALRSRPARYRGGKAKGPHAAATADRTLNEWTVRKEKALAETRELDLALRRGALIEVALVRQTRDPIIRGLMQRCLSWPGMFAFEIPTLTAHDRAIMERIIRDELTDASLGRGFDFSGIPGFEDWEKDHAKND